MAINTSSTTVSHRYFMRKNRDWLNSHIQTLAGILKIETPWTEGFDKHALVSICLKLHDRLPDDPEAPTEIRDSWCAEQAREIAAGFFDNPQWRGANLNPLAGESRDQYIARYADVFLRTAELRWADRQP